HEEGLAGPARFAGGDAQPAHAFAGDKRIIVKAAARSTTDVATRTEYVEAVRLSSLAVVDRRLRVEDPLAHLELAEVCGLVAEPFQHGPHVGDLRIQSRHEGVVNVINHVMKVGCAAGEERCARRRAHGRGDVMILEPDTVTSNRIEGRQRIIGSSKQPVSLLVNDDENDVVGWLGGVGCGRLRRDRGSTQEDDAAQEESQETLIKLGAGKPYRAFKVRILRFHGSVPPQTRFAACDFSPPLTVRCSVRFLLPLGGVAAWAYTTRAIMPRTTALQQRTACVG